MFRIILFVPLLLLLNIIDIRGTDLVTTLTNETEPTFNSFTFDDHEWKNLALEVKLLNEITKNLRKETENNNLNFRIELAAITQKLNELNTQSYHTDNKELVAFCSNINTTQTESTKPLSTSLAEEYQRTFMNHHCIPLEHFSNVTQSLENKILSTANVKSEIEDVQNVLQLQINDLSASVKNEISNLRDLISNSVKSTVDSWKETIQPQVNNILNISHSLQNAVEKSLQQTKESLAKITERVKHIPKTYPSCVEALQNGGESGVYKLYLSSSGLDPFHVYCLKDPENGHAWTVVQRRQDGSVDFYRNWEEYKNGFGDLNGEYFIGLEKLHALTNQAIRQKLWIQLGDWEGQSKSVTYTDFQIGNEDSKYALTKIGGHSGDFPNTFYYHDQMKFTTKDSDNDIDATRNCAVKFTGAWWFHQCHNMHLNGVYHHWNPVEFGQGVANDGWHGEYYSSKYAHMAIRPVS